LGKLAECGIVEGKFKAVRKAKRPHALGKAGKFYKLTERGGYIARKINEYVSRLTSEMEEDEHLRSLLV
jgi:hypothetical protein